MPIIKLLCKKIEKYILKKINLMKVSKWIQVKRLVVLTGAGMSAESGLKTFRGYGRFMGKP